MAEDGRYQNKGKLGEGGMGVVYRAWDAELMRDVAIKVIRWDAITDNEARLRFDQEAKSAGMLKHPNIVTIYDRGEVNGQPFIVMEMVEGRTLHDLIKSGEPGPTQMLAILKQVAAALDYAHGRQVVHRDIKPANIMVQPDGTAKVMDFGIAKSELGGSGVTAAGMMVGSPHYVPPERYTTGAVSGSTDLWALAVTAYEALAGRRPFQADNWDTLTYRVCHEPVPDPGQSVPKAAGAALLKALSKKPEDRFPDCSSFVDALAEGFKPPVVVAPPPLAPPPSRTKLYAIAGTAAGLILAGVLWFATRPVQPPPQPPVSKEDPPAAPAALLNTPTGDMVLVTAGEARLGKQADQAVTLPAFYIDKTEVPVSAYLQFCQATGRSIGAALRSAKPDFPVVDLTWQDAHAFAAWAGKRLPTALEWEKAARGSGGQPLPWRGETRSDRANIPLQPKVPGGLVSVISFAAGASPYGALNMVGNASEWTATQAPAAQLDQYRKIFRELNPPLSEADVFYEVRGGSFKLDAPLSDWPVFVWDFLRIPARARRPDIGFRCVREVP